MTLEKLCAADILNIYTQYANSTNSINLVIEQCIPSTNDYLLDLLSQQPQPPTRTVVLAETQTGGKGQQGRVWISPPGNIYLSLYWTLYTSLEKLYGLSVVVGIAVARVLKANGLSEVKLKWPNDIFWQQRKMGGILIETKSRSGVVDAVIGLGLNICDMQAYHAQISQKCVSLEDALQSKVDRNKLVAQLLCEMDQVLTLFQAHGFDIFVADWQALDIAKGPTIIGDKIQELI